MWSVIENSAKHVSVYSTFLGESWYLILFVFRLIVVATIGVEVYKDEQSLFQCSTKVVGCENVCYNRFAKISHIRFWAFQILTLATPVVLFHFYTTIIESKIEKLKDEEAEEKDFQPGDDKESQWKILKKRFELERRKQKLGGWQRKRYTHSNNSLKIVNYTKGIHFVYFLTVLSRLAIEFIFLVLAFDLFTFASNQTELYEGVLASSSGRINNFFDLFWIRVPQLYRCSGQPVSWACGQHLLPGNKNAYVPCWVSRPWEKTIFLRYMNSLGLLGFILCAVELIYLAVKFAKNCTKNIHEKKSKAEYSKAPSTSSFSDLVPIPNQTVVNTNPSGPSGDNYYETNETPKDGPTLTVAQPLIQQSTEPAIANILDDIPTRKFIMKRLNEITKNSEVTDAPPVQAKTEANQTTNLPVLNRRRKPIKGLAMLPDDKRNVNGPKASIFPRSFGSAEMKYPTGTRSLQRPPKLVKRGHYATMFEMSSVSSAHEDDDGDDDDKNSSDSSDETRRESVSVYSSQLDARFF